MHIRFALVVLLLVASAAICYGKGGDDGGDDGGNGGSNSGKGGGGGDDGGKPTTTTKKPATTTTKKPTTTTTKKPTTTTTKKPTTTKPAATTKPTTTKPGDTTKPAATAAPPSGGGQVECNCAAIDSCTQQTRQAMIACVNACIAGSGGNVAAVQQCYAQNQAAAIMDVPDCMKPFTATMCSNASGVPIAASATQPGGVCDVMENFNFFSMDIFVENNTKCVSQCQIAAGNAIFPDPTSCGFGGSNCPAQLGCAMSKPSQPNNQANDQVVAACEQTWFAQLDALCFCLNAAGANAVQMPPVCGGGGGK